MNFHFFIEKTQINMQRSKLLSEVPALSLNICCLLLKSENRKPLHKEFIHCGQTNGCPEG